VIWRLALLGALAFGLAAASGCGQKLEPALFSAGSVDQGESFRGHFRLENSAAKALRILDLDFGCPCATGKSNLSVVEGGAEARIDFRFETRGLEGKVAKVLRVKILDAEGKRREIRARIEVEVLPPWSLAPPRWNFGEVDAQAQLERRFEIQYRDAQRPGGNRSHPKLVVDDPRLQAVRDDAGHLRAVIFRREAPALSGPFRDSFRLREARADGLVRSVVIEGRVRGDLDVQPRELNFGLVAPGRGARRILTIRSRSGCKFRILAVKDRGALTLRPFSSEASVRHTLDFRLPADLPAGRSRGSLIIDIEGRAQPLSIPFRYGVRGS
jgi:uncharacterized protein DUF1573